ncbi:MAG: WecB/TagA/CpsF family glycosyltransferase [Methylobacteriaceae bacterium]|nr:WecB/TagA/CpsF family glycosyltransferase [Methylobacteriaceae bacterium]
MRHAAEGAVTHPAVRDLPRTWLGGLPIAVLDLPATADLIVTAVGRHPAHGRPLIMTSANSQVVSRCRREPATAALFAHADVISADGQPLVIASRILGDHPLPERVATTDLFPNVARRAEELGLSFYLFGATEDENRRAFERIRARFPRLCIAGRSHGYLGGAALERRVAEINAAAPDIVWVALGVPREQAFCARFAKVLGNVGVLKTSGGLFNFLSGSRARAPLWMQQACLEWAFRVAQEPRRLFLRYALTSPHAIYLLARSRRLSPSHVATSEHAS